LYLALANRYLHRLYLFFGCGNWPRNLLTSDEGFKYNMDLFFIRHGESFNNALTDTSQRVADPGLTDRGERQAERLGPFLANLGHLDPAERDDRPAFDQLYCSPMLRTLQTATPAAETLGLPLQVWVDVHEVGGVWVDGVASSPGMPRSQIEAEFPVAPLPDGITEQGWWMGGQETPAQGRGRAMAIAVELQERAKASAMAGRPAERIGIVSHGDFMSSMVKALTDQLPGWNTYYSHNNTAIDRFTFADLFLIRYVNRIAHLDKPELVSQ
jgi:broad specificity phosphatase PhoE